jgi:hypothetical protein
LLSIEDQYELYIYSMANRHPPDISFAYDMALNGKEIVPFLAKKLNEEHSELIQYSIILIFDMMVRHFGVDLKENNQLIEKIRSITLLMKNAFFREESKASLTLITSGK